MAAAAGELGERSSRDYKVTTSHAVVWCKRNTVDVMLERSRTASAGGVTVGDARWVSSAIDGAESDERPAARPVPSSLVAWDASGQGEARALSSARRELLNTPGQGALVSKRTSTQ